MSYSESSPGLIYGILWAIIIGFIIYLLCSLFSWNFDYSEWNLFSRILKWIGIIIEIGILLDVVLQLFHRI